MTRPIMILSTVAVITLCLASARQVSDAMSFRRNVAEAMTAESYDVRASELLEARLYEDEGADVDAQASAQGPVLVVYVLARNCPACDATVSALVGVAPVLSERGFSVLIAGDVITPDLRRASQSLLAQHVPVSLRQIANLETFRAVTGVTLVPTSIVLEPLDTVSAVQIGSPDVPLAGVLSASGARQQPGVTILPNGAGQALIPSTTPDGTVAPLEPVALDRVP